MVQISYTRPVGPGIGSRPFLRNNRLWKTVDLWESSGYLDFSSDLSSSVIDHSWKHVFVASAPDFGPMARESLSCYFTETAGRINQTPTTVSGVSCQLWWRQVALSNTVVVPATLSFSFEQQHPAWPIWDWQTHILSSLRDHLGQDSVPSTTLRDKAVGGWMAGFLDGLMEML